MPMTPDQLDRYARHIVLKEIGGPGQKKLRAASVLVVGAGGLGSPAALYLAAAGVGAIGIADPDEVSLSNLQRQILYRTRDVGKPKVSVAADVIAALNPDVQRALILGHITPDNAIAAIEPFDVVLDGSDNFETRFALNAACYALERPLISGAVGRWTGQLTTFRAGLTKDLPADQRAPCYNCLVPEAPPEAEDCETAGIVGALTGVIGAAMALEAVKEITGAGQSLAGRLMIYEGLSAETRTLSLPPDPLCPVCGDGND